MQDSTEIKQKAAQPPVEFGVTDKALADLREKFSVVPDANTDEGYKEIKASLKVLTPLRTGVEAKRKELKADAIAWGKKVDGEAKRISAEIVKLEEPLKAAKTVVDERKRREKEERIRRLQEKVNAIYAYPTTAIGQDSEVIAKLIEELDGLDVDDFYDLSKEAAEAKTASMEKLTELLSETISREQEEGRRKEEEEARIKEEARLKAEEDARREEEDARRKIEDDRLAEEKAEMERKQEEFRKQQEEFNRQQETLRQQQEELDRKAEEQAQREEEEENARIAEQAQEDAAMVRQEEALAKENETDIASGPAATELVCPETEQIAREEEQEKREYRSADRNHRGTINGIAMKAMIDGGLSEECAKAAIVLIAQDQVPNVTISY